MLRFLILFLGSFFISSCSAINYGINESKAKDYYHLITWNKKDFGTKRLKISRRFHNNTQFSCFLDNNPKPDFMLEYTGTDKKEIIHLYYVKSDSVFIFKECKPNKVACVNLIKSRTLTQQELLTYETLKKGTVKIKSSFTH